LLLSLAGGTIMYAGVFVLTSGIAFYTVQGLDWIYLLTNASYHITRAPIDYLPRLLRQAFTFVVPVLLVAYYPASVICGWGAPTYSAFLALPAGLAFLCLSLLVWRVGVRHYKSTGS